MAVAKLHERKVKGYGWRPDTPDMRDHLFAVEPSRSLPSEVSLRSKMPTVFDQGQLGCHDEATEVLTEDGWKFWQDYDGTVALATINQDTRMLEFDLPTALHSYDYAGPMHYLDSRSLDAALTPNHRMWVRRWDERARTLRDDYAFVEMGEIGWYSGLLASPVGWRGADLARIAVGREYDGDDFLALVALVISDGWAGGTEANRNTVSFCCFRDDRVEMVRGLAARLGLHEVPGRPGVWKWSDGELAAWLRQHCYVGDTLRSPCKRVPGLVKQASERQIRLFLKHFGDQHVGTNNRQFYTSNPTLAADLQELLLRVGRRSGIYEREPRAARFPDGHQVEARDCAADLTVTEWVADNLSIERKQQVEVESYKGGVFCATVPNGLLVTRRHGKVLISGNSCTGNAVAGVLEYERRRQSEKGVKTPSRLFIYYNERVIEGTVSQDAGAEIRDGIKVVATLGAPDETDWPYDISKFTEKPPTQAYTDAKKYKALSYARVPQAAVSFQSVLAQRYAIVFGFSVYEAFESSETASSGIVPMPTPGETMLGGHAVVASGYKLINGQLYFLVRNSWGKDWGLDGYFYMPAAYITSPSLASDFWAIQLAS